MSENKNEQPQAVQAEQELNELLQIRRDKLAKLQEAGKDPFVITTCPRDHYAQEIRDQFETCLLYTSPSPRDRTRSRMPSSA